MADAATTEKVLTNSYQAIITGACLATVEKGVGVLYRFDSSAPSESDPGHSLFVVPGETAYLSYPGGLTVYAKIHPRFQDAGVPTVISVTGV